VLTARRLELGCWLLILVLTGSLAMQSTPPRAPSARNSAEFVFIDDPPSRSAVIVPLNVAFTHQCIEEVIQMSHQWPRGDLIREMDRLCFSRARNQRSTAMSFASSKVACLNPLGFRRPISSTAVRGCLRD
jgi:hypothetical protein